MRERAACAEYWCLPQVAAVRELLDDQAEPADEGQFSSIFFHSANRDLTELHPPPQMGYYLYQAYKLAVDPVLHVLHKGTFERDYTAFQQAKESGTADTTDGFEALVFAVYYAAVISMQPDAVFTRYGVEKHMLANHYRFALEHALSNANFLHCEHFYTLQALTIFVVSPTVCARAPPKAGLAEANVKGKKDTNM